MAVSIERHVSPFVYKIATAPPPNPIPAVLPLSELDEKDAFIHLSDAKQVPVTADLFFGEEMVLWVYKISTEGTNSRNLRWPDNLTGCAHLYEKSLGNDNITEVKHWSKDTASEWKNVLVDAWLE